MACDPAQDRATFSPAPATGVAPPASLDEARRLAARELERLPAPLRRLEASPGDPVTVGAPLKALADQVDREVGQAQA